MTAAPACPRPLIWCLQPPPPPPAAPPPPPAAMPPAGPPPVAYGAPPPRKKGVSPWWFVLGCGCLLIVLLIAVGIYGGAKLWKGLIQPELQKNLPYTPPVPSTQTFESPQTVAEPSPPQSPAVSAKPGKEAAMKAALGSKPDWVAKVKYASADWQRVQVWVGPPASEFIAAVVLQWNSQNGSYDIERTDDIPQFDAPASLAPAAKPRPVAKPVVAKKPVPAKKPAVSRPPTSTSSSQVTSSSGPQPSRKRAMAKCLAQAPGSGWVARASDNSGDWTECTVMIGPPNSEFVEQFHLRWVPSRHNYAITGRSSIGN